MRPDPTEPHDNGSGRIIYLGEVRRKRSSRRRQAPDRHYLFTLGLIALAGWGAWLAVLFTLPPSRLLTYVAFFAPMAVALTATASLGAYAVEWRRGLYPSLRACVRRGFLFALLVIANLAVLAAHRWTVLFGAASAGAVILIELWFSLRRR